MKRLALLAALACGPLLHHAHAQQLVYGVEPNGTKEQATPALGLVDGDQIWNEYSATGLNFFRVGTASAPEGIYRHTLENEDPCWATLFGSSAVVDLVLPGSTQPIQPVQTLEFGSPHRIAWYGFGRAEEVYVELTGHYNYRGPGAALLRTTPVVPQDLGVLPLETVSGSSVYLTAYPTAGAGNDNELHLFDERLRPIPGHWRDDPYGIGGSASLIASLPQGRYYVACTEGGISSALPANSAVTDEFALFGVVTDDVGAVAANQREPTAGIELTVSTNSPYVSLRATNNETLPFELSWFTFVVGSELGADEVVFCAGDGPGLACPCGAPTPGTVEGCPNSTGRGGEAICWRARWSSPVARVTLRGLPAGATAQPFVGFGHGANLPLGGGRLCLEPGAVRLPLLAAGADGTAEAGLDLSLVPGTMAGQLLYLQGAYRDVAAPAGCQVNITSGTSLRL